MRDAAFHLKKWEIALLVSVCVTVLVGLFLGETDCAAWWGTMYPELTDAAGGYAPAAAAGGGGVVLRFRCAEWLSLALKRLRCLF